MFKILGKKTSLMGEYSVAEGLGDKIKNSDKLKLQSIVDAIGFFLFPSASLTNSALRNLLIENNCFDSLEYRLLHLFNNP